MAATFDSAITLASESIRIKPSVLLDLENEGVAVGILLLSCIQAEINLVIYVLPVNSGLQFTSHTDVEDYSH